MSKKNNNYKILLAIIISIGLTYLSDYAFVLEDATFKSMETSILEQSVYSEELNLKTVNKVYYKNQLLGVLDDRTLIDTLLAETQENDYITEFPNSKLQLGEDMYIIEEDSYFSYENIDQNIIDYIIDNNLFAIEVNKVDFSNGNTVYVKSIADFEQAKNQYLLNFIGKEDFDTLAQGGVPEAVPMGKYGYRVLGLAILETISYSKGFASKENILMDVNDIVAYLSYGYTTEIVEYTVEQYDTVEYVAYQTGLTPQQIVTLNSDRLLSTNQLLTVGEKLNVTYFNSPINISVTRERVVQEPIYPGSTEYVADPTLREGVSVVEVRERNGSKRVVYKETYINGVVQANPEIVETTVLQQPVREVTRYGTMIIPGIGTGNFRSPVDNFMVTCGWYCYPNHTAADFQNRYNRYDNAYAADRGIVEVVGYTSINGYYMWINHNNGYRSYYGHLNKPAYFSVGATVLKGDAIGQIGMTGLVTGPLVHFMLTYNGSYINPCTVLSC